MWPVTWAADGKLYAAAGDNSGSPMNFWKIVFLDAEGNPRPYHQAWPDSSKRSQLTLFEAPEPWGPWSLFYRDDTWGNLGGYQPNFTKTNEEHERFDYYAATQGENVARSNMNQHALFADPVCSPGQSFGWD